MQDLKERIKELTERFFGIAKNFSLEVKKTELLSLEAKTTNPDLWNDPENAKKLMQQFSDVKKEIDEFENLQAQINTLEEFSKDEEFSEKFTKEVNQIEKDLKKFELASFLSGIYDKKNAIISIHAGQGGTEAMDWASMLLRMYHRFCERREWKTDVLDMTEGEETGIKSVTFKVTGTYSYGYLKKEAGTHRLVRQSPFNADKLRQTSFALVEILPELTEVDLPDIEIKEEDIELQFFRSSSKGGQNVQKVSTAVRIIHKPTGITVSAQSERFQEQNRKNALSLLKSKLWHLKESELASQRKELKGGRTMASWGTQIRSYVLHPYKMIKDLRTNVETGNTERVLDGELDEFIEAELKM